MAVAELFPTFRAAAAWLYRALPTRRAIVRASAGGAVFCALGYLSNLLAFRGCVADSRDAVQEFFDSAQSGRQISWLSPDELVDVFVGHDFHAEAFGTPATGLVARYQDAWVVVNPLYLPRREASMPWAYVRLTRPYAPFVVQVGFGCLAKDLYGEAGVHTYLTLFGARLRIRQRTLWYS